MRTGLGDWAYVAAVILGSFLTGLAIDIVGVGLLGHDSGPGRACASAVAKALRGQIEVWADPHRRNGLQAVRLPRPGTRMWIDRVIVVLAVLSVTIFFARLAG